MNNHIGFGKYGIKSYRYKFSLKEVSNKSIMSKQKTALCSLLYLLYVSVYYSTPCSLAYTEFHTKLHFIDDIVISVVNTNYNKLNKRTKEQKNKGTKIDHI